jgi:DNA adenine methylase
MFEPIVKWSGSKRSQAESIVARMPREIDTYYEPFCGGCSVLYRLLHTPVVKVRRYIASDLNADLIALWNEIKDNPERLIRIARGNPIPLGLGGIAQGLCIK